MGLGDLLITIVSLIAAPIALVLVLGADRVAGRRLVPRACRHPLAAVLFLSVSASTGMILLSRRSPEPAHAGSAPEMTLEVASELRIFVYPLEAWGDEARRLHAGEEFARTTIETLRGHDLSVAEGIEHYIPLDVFQSERTPDQNLQTIYRRRVPFVCIWGTVSRKREGGLEAHLSVDRLDVTLRPERLSSAKISISNSKEAIEQAARDFALGVCADLR